MTGLRRRIAPLLIFAAVFVGIASAPATALAGPWAPEAGHGYVKLWLKYLWGFSYNASDGNSYAYGAYHEVFFNVYAELGLAEHVGLIVHAPVLESFHLDDPRGAQSHLTPGDPTLSLRWQFLTIGRFVAGVDAGVRAPFARPGPVQTVHTTDEGHAPIGALRIGTGVWDFPVTLSVGHGWDDFYLAASVGYIVRTDGYDHVLTWSAEGGSTIDSHWSWRVRAVGYHSLGVFFDVEAPGHESPSGIGNGTSYMGFALEADYQIEPGWMVGLTLEGGLGVLIRQTGGPVVSLYLARRF